MDKLCDFESIFDIVNIKKKKTIKHEENHFTK